MTVYKPGTVPWKRIDNLERLSSDNLQTVTNGLALGRFEERLQAAATPQWPLPSEQIERALNLWPGITVPEPPQPPKGLGLVLHVPDSAEALWDKVTPPEGYTKSLWPSALWADKRAYPSPPEDRFTQPVWLALNLRGSARSVHKDIATNANKALSALIQNPNWALEWSENGPYSVNMLGYGLSVATISEGGIRRSTQEGRLVLRTSKSSKRIDAFFQSTFSDMPGPHERIPMFTEC